MKIIMLQRVIDIIVKKDFIQASSDKVGTSGDHRSTIFEFDIQESGLVSSQYTYRLQLNDLVAVLELEGDKLRFEIPSAVLYNEKVLQVQLTVSQGDSCVYVSDILDFAVAPNLCTDLTELKYNGLLDESVENFTEAVESFKAICGNLPYIDSSTLTWWVFDTETQRYKDTKVKAVCETTDIPLGSIQPMQLSFFENHTEQLSVLPLCSKEVGRVNEYGQIDSSASGYYTYTLTGENHVGNDMIYTTNCYESVYVNSGGMTRKMLNGSDRTIYTQSGYTKLYITTTYANDSRATAYYANYGKIDEYVVTDEKVKKAIINCINDQ